MEYLNIAKDNNIVIAEDKKYPRQALVDGTIKEINKSGSTVLSLEFAENQFSLKCVVDDKHLSFDLFLKNITGAGWKDKPYVKRCQVSNIQKKNPVKNDIVKDKHYNLILGYYNFDSNPIFVAWDPYRYLHHKTLRSCYVTVDALKRGYEKKFFECVVSSQKCWIFIGERFAEFVERYISYISDTYLKGE